MEEAKKNKKFNISLKIKSFFSRLFQKYFSFENGVDISDETQVLYRRNKVIKNIIFVTNILYTAILFVVSRNDSTNLILSTMFIPVTLLLNTKLGKIIAQNEKDYIKQLIAAYIQCFYMFLSATIVYIRLKNQFDSLGNEVIYSEVGYAMVYVSLVVVSLYQDKKLLGTVNKWLLVLITILHCTVTYNFVEDYGHSTVKEILSNMLLSDKFKDMILRTSVLALFMIVLYVNVAISEYLMEERKKELSKRKQVENDFISVVKEMFNISINDAYISSEEERNASLLSNMSFKLASNLALEPFECDNVKAYSRIYLDKKVDLDKINSIENKDDQFEELRQQTTIGNQIAKRLSLRTKVDSIVRTQVLDRADPEFVDKMKLVHQPIEDQIIAICDVYITLRESANYKRPYNHSQAINAMEKDFKQYFDNIVYDRFIHFSDDFKNLYETFGGSNYETN
ncbi:MAG: hypothetical protein K6G28_05255 [Acholeplasmatales bacterium]|nr:hypothetical protein [Acholeplasmatales bacterium]